MIKVVVVGGGWAGCAAALAASKAGAQVVLLERTDLLLGTGLVGGIFRNNGRFTAAEEAIAMGGGDLFVAMDANTRHRGIDFPGHSHASFYDVTTMEPLVKRILQNYGIDIKTCTRVSGVVKHGKKIQYLTDDNEQIINGDAFVDTTGTTGPMGNCLKYGNGCAMCILRCPTFGPRVSLTAKAEIKEIMGKKADGSYGAMSGSCKINKDSLSFELKAQLEKEGMVVIPLPENLKKTGMLGKKACSQYAIADYAENIVLIDTGHAKLMTPFFPLDMLRTIPGLERARYEDPYSGGVGNSIRYLGIAPCDSSLKVEGIDNLFCAGEKSGILVGHTEAVVTGLLAGNNAVRCCLDMQYLGLPPELASGDFIRFIHEQMTTEEGIRLRYTFSGSIYFERMKSLGLYSAERRDIMERINKAGLTDIYNTCLV
ncbi:tRNA uridine 5-carboxymethylaminomethyl modification enzyme GidA [Sporomusa ovata DSM 2662]|uniref:Fragment flavodoxin oxidoreductase n=1 Tax=Sporomusa ovata TaxID=2378 RepID=A0A0U1L3S1_9FIRM|nr:FAD-dependent oxidoreductase [Sporomusa ovata]EQB25766.1 glucose inhibited division protein A [Sporomusa ovata DSM 2662]CQR74328.1 Fragment flavodoxin oxidoreductase [Sporomusa ovata]